MEAKMTARVERDQKSGRCHVVDDATGPLEEINAFLRAMTTRGLSLLTVRAYAFDLTSAYRWMTVTKRTLAELTRADLLDFVAHEKERGAEPASINRRLIALRLLHRFWHPNGMGTAAGESLPSPHYRGRGRDRRLGLGCMYFIGALLLQESLKNTTSPTPTVTLSSTPIFGAKPSTLSLL
jgi:hypothetical protein